MAAPFDAHKNFSYGTVLTAPSPATTGTTLVLGAGEGAEFPDPSTDGEYNVTIWPTSVQPLSSNAEIVRVTAKSTDTLTIVRQQESTSARTILVGDQVALTITTKIVEDIENLGTSSQVKNETPGGSIDGSNVDFTTAADYQTDSLRVYLNGQRLKGGGDDYTEVSSGFTMVTAPVSGDILLVDYDTNTSVFATGSTSFIYNELVNETPNDVITAFTVDFPYVAGSTQVFRDGQLMRPGGEDYTETTPASGIITFTTAPVTGSIILVTYQQSLSVVGNADTLDGYHASTLLDAALDLTRSNLFLNALINGNMDVWQRGTTAVPLAKATSFAADRWYCARTLYAAGLTVSRQDGTGVAGSRYALRLQRDSADSNTDWIKAVQAIETSNTVNMRGNKWTLSFWARAGADYSASSNNLEVGFASRTAVDEDPAVYGTIDDGTTIQLTTSWVKYTVTTSAVIVGTTNTFKVIFNFDPTGTASTNDYFEITQVQLNQGESANVFQPKSFAQELADCQRYYIKYPSTNNGFVGTTGNSDVSVNVTINTPVEMRDGATFTNSGATLGYRGNGNLANIPIFASPTAVALKSGNNITIIQTGVTTGLGNQQTIFCLQQNLAIDAEL